MFIVNGDIKLDTFEIHESCDRWFNTNVKVVENHRTPLFSSRSYHIYKNKKIIGYICANNEPS